MRSLVGLDTDCLLLVGKFQHARGTAEPDLFAEGNVALGQQHSIRVISRRYRFSAQVLTVNDNLSNVNFVGLE